MWPQTRARCSATCDVHYTFNLGFINELNQESTKKLIWHIFRNFSYHALVIKPEIV